MTQHVGLPPLSGGGSDVDFAEADQREMAERRHQRGAPPAPYPARRPAIWHSATRRTRRYGSRAAAPPAAERCSMKRRMPASALTRVRMISSPPGRSTRANSSSAASGFGTAVTTYCAITTSKELSGNSSFSASITASPSTFLSRNSADALLGLLQHGFRNVGAEDAQVRPVLRKGNAGTDADLEHAPADPVGRSDRRPCGPC